MMPFILRDKASPGQKRKLRERTARHNATLHDRAALETKKIAIRFAELHGDDLPRAERAEAVKKIAQEFGITAERVNDRLRNGPEEFR